MDVLTISAADASRLKIPFGGASGRPRAHALLDLSSQSLPCPALGGFSGGRDDAVQLSDPSACTHEIPLHTSTQAQGRRDVVIDVRARGDPASAQRQASGSADPQVVLDVPGFAVPLGYALFAVGLGFTNTLDPSAGSAVCVGLSPLLSCSLTVHALGTQSWAGVGLLLCAWLAPSVCATWRLAFALGFFVVLGVLVAASTHRMLASFFLVALLLSILLVTQTRWLGADPRWGVVLGGFFLALECVAASVGGGRVVYRIRRGT